MIYNKKFIIGFLLFVAICGVALVAFFMTRKTPEPVTSTPPQDTVSKAPFTIKNFSSYEDLDITTKSSIVSAIGHYIDDTPHKSDPVGVVREGSYKETSDGTISNITFLVDIASLKRTYKIDFGTDTSRGERSLYTLCPSASELIYPAFDCKDDLSEN